MNKGLEEDSKVIVLKNVKVEFANLEENNPLGKSILIVVDDPTVKTKIETWVAQNKIGKEHPGVAQFSEYDGVRRFKFKFANYTEVTDMNGGYAKEGLNRGAIISLVAKAYEYNHKQFGSGVGQSLLSVVVMEPATNEAKIVTGALLDELQSEANSSESQAEADVVPDDIPGEIDLSKIPF